MDRLSLYNDSVRSCVRAVLEGRSGPDALLPLGLPKSLQESLTASWLRCAKLGIDPAQPFSEAPAPAQSDSSTLSDSMKELYASLSEKTARTFGDVPCTLFFLDAKCNVFFRYDSPHGGTDAWPVGLVRAQSLSESFCGTCAHLLTSQESKTALLVGAMHYCDVLDESLSVAARLEVRGSLRGFIVAFLKPDAERLLSPAFQGIANSAIQVLATATETAVVAELRGSRNQLMDDILNNLLLYSTDAIVVVDTSGRLRSANVRARKLLGLTSGQGGQLPSIGIYAPKLDLLAAMQSGRVMSDVEVRFTSTSGAISYRCDMRPIVGRDREHVVGTTLRLRPDSDETGEGRLVRLEDLKGAAGPFLHAKRVAMLTAPTYEAALITGGIGTGKRTFAKAMHLSAHGTMDSFAMVDCSYADSADLEAMLFGMVDAESGEEVQGAYLDANGGTLVLNGVGELPLALQGAIMRALDSNEVRRPGKAKPSYARVKLVAINRTDDLQDLVAQGAFREDLFYRLSAVHIKLPDLADRRGDIMDLAESFIDEFCVEQGVPPIGVTGRARSALRAYSWPGNVAQLRYFVRHACYVCSNGTIDLNCLPEILVKEIGMEPQVDHASEDSNLSMREARRRQVAEAMRSADGNITRAAKILGVSRATLYRWRREEGAN